MTESMGEHHYGQERQESATEKAEQIVRRELDKAGWTDKDLALATQG